MLTRHILACSRLASCTFWLQPGTDHDHPPADNGPPAARPGARTLFQQAHPNFRVDAEIALAALFVEVWCWCCWALREPPCQDHPLWGYEQAHAVVLLVTRKRRQERGIGSSSEVCKA